MSMFTLHGYSTCIVLKHVLLCRQKKKVKRANMCCDYTTTVFGTKNMLNMRTSLPTVSKHNHITYFDTKHGFSLQCRSLFNTLLAYHKVSRVIFLMLYIHATEGLTNKSTGIGNKNIMKFMNKRNFYSKHNI